MGIEFVVAFSQDLCRSRIVQGNPGEDNDRYVPAVAFLKPLQGSRSLVLSIDVQIEKYQVRIK
jgi:hypothetical protein